MCCDEWIDVLGVRVDRKTLYVEHNKRVRGRMAEVVSKISGLCCNKGGMDKKKVCIIMGRVAESVSMYGSEI